MWTWFLLLETLFEFQKSFAQRFVLLSGLTLIHCRHTERIPVMNMSEQQENEGKMCYGY